MNPFEDLAEEGEVDMYGDEEGEVEFFEDGIHGSDEESGESMMEEGEQEISEEISDVSSTLEENFKPSKE